MVRKNMIIKDVNEYIVPLLSQLDTGEILVCSCLEDIDRPF